MRFDPKVWAVAVAVSFAATGAQSATIVGGSDILTGSSAAQLESWLVNDPSLSYNGPLQFTNIFDAGSSQQGFHAAVDGKGPTIVVMSVKTGDNSVFGIIGGFNPQSWSTTGWHSTPNPADMTAFIFNLTSGERRDQATQWQTYNDAFSPGFSSDISFGVGGTSATTYSNDYCVGTGPCNGLGTNTANILGQSGTTFLAVTSFEVFTIQEAPSPVPLPATLPLFASGLGALGLAAWRRKRKTATA